MAFSKKGSSSQRNEMGGQEEYIWLQSLYYFILKYISLKECKK